MERVTIARGSGRAGRSVRPRTPRRSRAPPRATRPKYSPWGNATRFPAKRSPPTCVLSHVASGSAAANAWATGRPRSAQLDRDGRVCRPRRRDRRRRRNCARGDRGRRHPRSGRASWSRPRPRGCRRRGSGRHPARHGRCAVRSADQQDPRAGSPLETAERSTEPLGEAGVLQAVATPRAVVLDQEPASDRGRRAGQRLSGREAPQGTPVGRSE